MTPSVEKYLDMICKQLDDIRQRNAGADSLEEDELMDEMDRLWYSMSQEEHAEINRQYIGD